MIFKHKVYFFFWKLYVKIILPSKGKLFNTYWSNKNLDYSEIIKAKVISYNGISIDKQKFEFLIDVKFKRPIQGKNKSFFSSGSYNLKDFKKLRKNYNIEE